MALSFRGEHNQKVDGKGRMSIPADFRRVLEAGDPTGPRAAPRMYLLYGDHLKNYLAGYTIEAFTEVVDQIKRLPRGSDAQAQSCHV